MEQPSSGVHAINATYKCPHCKGEFVSAAIVSGAAQCPCCSESIELADLVRSAYPPPTVEHTVRIAS